MSHLWAPANYELLPWVSSRSYTSDSSPSSTLSYHTLDVGTEKKQQLQTEWKASDSLHCPFVSPLDSELTEPHRFPLLWSQGSVVRCLSMIDSTVLSLSLDPFVLTMSSSLIFIALANQNHSLAYTLFLTALSLLLFIPLMSFDYGEFSVYSKTVSLVADYWWRKQHNHINLTHLNSCSWTQVGSWHTQWACNISLAHSCGYLDD